MGSILNAVGYRCIPNICWGKWAFWSPVTSTDDDRKWNCGFMSPHKTSARNITLTSQWALWCLKSPASPLFTQLFIQVQIKENIKALRHWPLCGEFTALKASNAENVSIWWRHHECVNVVCIESSIYPPIIHPDIAPAYRFKIEITVYVRTCRWLE